MLNPVRGFATKSKLNKYAATCGTAPKPHGRWPLLSNQKEHSMTNLKDLTILPILLAAMTVACS